ncbi:DoxX family protein [Aestuariivirga sp.]|uniref:DoxX family protein n=1 Tax=Aestuariivirga sp. TaxID=2650926 RepID=UPI0035942BB9
MIALLNKAEMLSKRLAPDWLTSAALRVALGVPFFLSGLTKWDGFGKLSESAVFLFTEEFKLHVFGSLIDYPFPYASAFAAGVGEVVLPISLVLGLFTRFAALALLAMTAIIQITVPSGWPIHLTWAAMALGIIAIGPGKVSIDRMWRNT